MEQLNSYDTTNAFAGVLHEHGILTSAGDVLAFFSKPYKWQGEYEDIMQIIMNYYGTEQVHITEAIDVVEIYEQVANYFLPNPAYQIGNLPIQVYEKMSLWSCHW